MPIAARVGTRACPAFSSANTARRHVLRSSLGINLLTRHAVKESITGHTEVATEGCSTASNTVSEADHASSPDFVHRLRTDIVASSSSPRAVVAAAGNSVGVFAPVKQRPHGTQHIQDYCRRHTIVYYHDFNARMIHKRRLRLQQLQAGSKQVVPQQQVVVPVAFAQADRPSASAMQHQLAQQQEAKRDTEELFGTFLHDARQTALAESKAKQEAQHALAAERHCLQETEDKLAHVAGKQDHLVEQLAEMHHKMKKAEQKSQQLVKQVVKCEQSSGLQESDVLA